HIMRNLGQVVSSLIYILTLDFIFLRYRKGIRGRKYFGKCSACPSVSCYMCGGVHINPGLTLTILGCFRYRNCQQPVEGTRILFPCRSSPTCRPTNCPETRRTLTR